MAKLLLIDDESSYAHMVKVLLRMRGHEVSLSLEACESVALFARATAPTTR
jgi:ActR/RegA family two-component response regulator